MQIITIDNKQKSITLKKDITIKNDLIYSYFSDLPQDKRKDMFIKALYIGVMALIEDRIASFLAKTKNELGTELERLKILFEMQAQLFSKSAVKGKYAEREIVTILNNFFEEKGWPDYAILVGDNQGKLKNIKTGDIMAYINGSEDIPVILEIKFSKSLPIGDISERDLKNNTNNIWGQLIEAKVNRQAKEAIIVFDKEISQDLFDKIGPATYIPNIGYVVFVNSQAGDFTNLFVVYSILRNALMELPNIKIIKPKLYAKILEKIINDIKGILDIKKLVESNIKNNNKLLSILENKLKQLEITKEYLTKLIASTKFTDKDIYNFFIGYLENKKQK